MKTTLKGRRRFWLAAGLLACAATSAEALDILLTNDDGFETANLRALHAQLKAAGHRVIVSAPAHNSSGTGGWIAFFKPIGALSKDTRYGAVKAGGPGLGADPADPEVHYVDGTPVMATLYGLDVAVPRAWKKAPDLVVSGPNEGNNLGQVVVSSGTFSNALYAINRGVPAIAVSYGDLASRNYTALTADAIEHEIGAVVVKLIAQLEASRDAGAPLLPTGIGLNVNIPKIKAGEGGKLNFAITRVGVTSNFQPMFYERLTDSPLAVRFGVKAAEPGISFVSSAAEAPTGTVMQPDTSPDSEGNALREGIVTISVVQGTPEAPTIQQDKIQERLKLTR